MPRQFTGKPYSPAEVRRMFQEETPEAFVMGVRSGRRTQQDEDASAATSRAITPIVQPEWTPAFARLMVTDREMRAAKMWWFYPVRRALAKLEPGEDWGGKRRERMGLLKRCMSMYLFSNYDAKQIARATGLKQHEASRALEEAARAMTPHIGVFGHALRQYDERTFLEGLGR